MSDEVTWPRVQGLLHEVMARWERREGRGGMPGIHQYRWETPHELATDSSMAKEFIEPGVPGEETNLVISLRKGFGNIPRMPMSGPFIKEEEIQEIVRWIDAGMPE